MMPEQDTSTTGYAAAAPLYWNVGWRGVLPLPARAKSKPPTGFTGKQSPDPSYPDILSWADLYPDGNLCLRMPDDVIGIDVDHYGAKTGADTFGEAEHRWGVLPPTVRSTSRDDGVSGIRLYRVPAGTKLAEGIEFEELGLGDIEICQRGHRYVIAWPSIHPENRPYWWFNQNCQHVGIPHPNDLPELPSTWIDNLPAPRQHLDLSYHYSTAEALTPGSPSSPVAGRLRQAIKELNLPGHSRHITCRGHVLALLRLGKRGEPGVEHALYALGEMFVALITPDRGGGAAEARAEYQNMVTGRGAATHLAQPSPTDWAHNLTTTVAVDPPPPPPPVTPLHDVENGFWDARDSLKAVYTTALSRMCSPWAVLAHTVARALTMVPAHTVLPAIIGGPGTLNWFAAVSAASGGGKGSAAACARTLIPGHVEHRNLGSGEGIIAAYGHQEDPSSVNAIMFTADEIDTITALNNRIGSTTMSVLRSAFSGEGLGFSYVNKDKRYRLDAHQYRLTLIASVQPERAHGLLGDAAGGTPQRFMWFPGTDCRITADPPWEAGPLTIPPLTEWLYPAEMKIPAEAEQFIRTERVKAMRGETEAIDGHAIFCREKLAYGLAVIDGRTDMTSEDWQLSGVAGAVSTWTRRQIADVLLTATDRDAEERGRLLGVSSEAADFEKAHRRGERVGRVLRWLLKTLDDVGDEGLTKRDLTLKMASRDRSMLTVVLVVAVDDGLIHQVEGRWMKR